MSRRRVTQVLAVALLFAAALGVRNQLMSQDEAAGPPPGEGRSGSVTIIGPDGRPMALSLDEMRQSIGQLRQSIGQPLVEKKEKRPFLGLATQELQDGVQQHLGLVPNSGLLVAQVVEGNPAATAGIQLHDILVELDGKPLFKTSDLVSRLRSNQGEPVKLLVLRAGQRMEISVTPVISEQPVWGAGVDSPLQIPQGLGNYSMDDLRLIYPGVRVPSASSEMQQLRKDMDEMRAQQAEMMKKLDEALRSR